ncbi:chitobiosyldiphosphodolichol beta-mannosyltransferase [Ceratina calcarata]|uniref:folate gamma-glutamyl hydrolase n=1 Tax=Ceratina calcarata TaxID=156304 RepID=A0AAJ7J8P6_9HYME|nr:chitobiosyldiphosphodolichol beta-mannosyltransferase [Ceratina calcarata]
MWGICLLCAIPVILFVLRKLILNVYKKRKHITIVVLGDLGRSPRMQYHALSFAKEGFTVDFVGYRGSTPLKEIRQNHNIHIHYLWPLPELEALPRLLYYAMKTVIQTTNLVWILVMNAVVDDILVQNPPAIPTIPVCWLYSMLVNGRLILDWHNYAYTLMVLNLGNDHLLVKITKLVESYFGSRADRNFCVSQAMKEDLERNWGVKAKVLYDRPAKEFRPISLTEKHEFLLSLSNKYDVFNGQTKDSTIFTECLENEVQLLSKRPGLLVSSTSWTEDEDFSILINALQDYENAFVEDDCNLPDLICVITGKGPIKEFYVAIVKLKNWKHVVVVTPWLANEDYPKMLASADLGISLHTSSSGLDLPMKVIDMFGCELPVCAYNFKCLSELVKHNENGMVFASDKELAAQLKSWFEDFPNNKHQQELEKKFRAELHEFQKSRWHGTDGMLNNRPIIGVLAQEVSPTMKNKIGNDIYTSYIAASYVKFIEGAGARVVPIMIGKNKAYYEDVLSQINGVLWPGGATYFNGGYADAGDIIYKIAKKMNENSDYFPIFGICLGFELLTYVVANRAEHRISCSSNAQTIPLVFSPDYRNSRMFGNISSEIKDILETKNVTANFHHFCVTKNALKKVGINDKFRILSTNWDLSETKFISSLEHVTYPFYGLQFHPEKNLYEWIIGGNIPHGKNAIKASQYFANFFVSEARKNTHEFHSKRQEIKSLIYNYNPKYTRLNNLTFEQCYFFE